MKLFVVSLGALIWIGIGTILYRYDAPAAASAAIRSAAAPVAKPPVAPVLPVSPAAAAFTAKAPGLRQTADENLSKREKVQLEANAKHGGFARVLGAGKFQRRGIRINEPFDYRSELLMLARALYSESNLPFEQEIIGWIVRNRVENGYRGELSYRAVTLDPIQFSAFNSPKLRQKFLALDFRSQEPGWQTTIRIARRIILADYALAPIPRNVMHFFSPRSMRKEKQAPDWASAGERLALPGVDPQRLQVFAGIN